MKKNPKSFLHRRTARGGFTLIEMTVVISIILGLVAVIFLGMNAYRAGSNRARCILNLASFQKMVRSAANLDSLSVGDTCDTPYLTTEGYLTATVPVCPADSSAYALLGTVPDIGVAYATCPNAASLLHAPSAATLANW